jgi:hypothetical protein
MNALLKLALFAAPMLAGRFARRRPRGLLMTLAMWGLARYASKRFNANSHGSRQPASHRRGHSLLR